MTTRPVRLLDTGPGAPAWNMALDEALLAGDDTTMRFYSWDPVGISLGRWQDIAAFTHRPEPVVRRLTGGGAILHSDALTISLTVPMSDPLYAGPVAASYERVHGWITAALGAAGLAVTPVGAAGDETDPWCFERRSAADLVAADGSKIVGSAQRRRGGRVLHHASIQVEGVDGGDLAAHLADHLGILAFEPRPGAPTKAETAEADRLALGRYGPDTTWTRETNRPAP